MKKVFLSIRIQNVGELSPQVGMTEVVYQEYVDGEWVVRCEGRNEVGRGLTETEAQLDYLKHRIT